MREIRAAGEPKESLMKLRISHGADPGDGSDPDWFVVKPLDGHTRTSVAGTLVTNDDEVHSLLAAGRTVYEIDAEPGLGLGTPDVGPIRLTQAQP
jgi:hypothetical protein